MKKTFTAIALALVLSVVVAPGSSAAVKAGATCKKAGLISITGGLKYTCVKKSGKLTWSKGVAVKPSAKPSVTAKPSVAPVSFTMGQVSANKSAAKCWSVINGNVYDLTAWINAHPGGEGAITSLCGIDGTQDFLAMHRNQSKPESRLSTLLLGPLAK
jgi:cytochrome b involved in lipid metabolism